MKRAPVPVAIAALLFAMVPAWALAASSPSPSSSTTPSVAASTGTPTPPVPWGSPSPLVTPTTSPPSTTPPGPASTPTPTPTPTPAPTPDPASRRLIEQARQQLGSGLADALSTIQRLSDAMSQNVNEQTRLQQLIDASQAKVDSLNAEIQRLDDEISTTQGRIDTERAQIGILARYLYVQPDALLLRLLRAGSVRDMVTQTSDLTAAALRANALERKLNADLAKLQRDQADRQRAADQEQQAQDQLNSAMSQLQDLSSQEQGSSDQLQSVIGDTQSTLDGLNAPGATLVQRVVDLLRQRQQQLIARAEQQVWQQAQLWATLNASAIPAPPATTLGGTRTAPAGTRLAWPIQGAVLTQGFGPSTLWLEPAMFGFQHFHTGLDLASPNTRIGAAADGVVAAVGSGTTGYGNYVIIVHGGGLVTLYGHLSVTMVKVGDTVTQGQQIGVEGSTGASTGLHLHFEVRVNGTPVDPSPYLPALAGA